MYPILTGILFVFILWMHYEIRKSKHSYNKSSDAYWTSEQDANLSRRVDISKLNYISIPLESLPMEDRDDSTLNSYRDIIRDLAGKEILNLTGLTNTELKTKYGIANINRLIECDNNYTQLVSMLHKWGERLYSQGYHKEAITILEFSVACLTDARLTYRLLAKIYMERNTPAKIDELIHTVPNTAMKRQDELIKDLMQARIL